MNAIGIIVLLFLILDVALNLAADLLNLKTLRSELPREFADWYDPERYRRSQRYLRENTFFGWIAAGFDLTVLLIFWFGGGFAFLDAWVRGLGYSPVVDGLVYIGTLVALKGVLSQPFDAYATFGIEARYGFNRTTWRTYLLDRAKGLLLGALLGLPLLAAVLLFFQYAGDNAWWLCWMVVVGFMLLVQYVAPTWIMPLFNRFEPLEPGELREAITAYARRIDFGLDNIFVMDGSKRSTKANAFFTGFGRHRRIVLFDNLIRKHSTDELVAVLAHEMGHYKQRHILKMMSIGVVQSGLMFYILSWFISYPGLFEAFYVPQPSVHAGLIFFGLLYTPIDTLLGMVVHAISRRHEYAADRFALSTAPQGKSLATALKKLSTDNLSNLQPHPFYVFLNYSHPPVIQRVEAIAKR
ncbi:MAG: M48 family peptidase [Desulfobacteraceae bacterium]|nr:MAG: M48 family peptidase [Desulfobacteraceae bacterium]